ncbi:hypothetical protein UPYG_G00082280 [Umbra pygmaea]|uniref:Uncharacterized protein n=1 Tax=Umbra pygmaea TaxID=75934 RepID=A0ABD0XTD2_UMBPY
MHSHALRNTIHDALNKPKIQIPWFNYINISRRYIEASGLTLNQWMARHIEDVMQLCCNLSANQEIKAALKSSAKGSAMAGGVALVGGLLGGPPGIAVGGAVGGLLGWWMTSGEFRPVPQIIMELPPHEQERLYADIMAVLGSLDWTDVVQLTTLVMGNATLQQQVTAALLSYITTELKAQVKYGD